MTYNNVRYLHTGSTFCADDLRARVIQLALIAKGMPSAVFKEAMAARDASDEEAETRIERVTIEHDSVPAVFGPLDVPPPLSMTSEGYTRIIFVASGEKDFSIWDQRAFSVIMDDLTRKAKEAHPRHSQARVRQTSLQRRGEENQDALRAYKASADFDEPEALSGEIAGAWTRSRLCLGAEAASAIMIAAEQFNLLTKEWWLIPVNIYGGAAVFALSIVGALFVGARIARILAPVGNPRLGRWLFWGVVILFSAFLLAIALVRLDSIAGMEKTSRNTALFMAMYCSTILFAGGAEYYAWRRQMLTERLGEIGKRLQEFATGASDLSKGYQRVGTEIADEHKIIEAPVEFRATIEGHLELARAFRRDQAAAEAKDSKRYIYAIAAVREAFSGLSDSEANQLTSEMYELVDVKSREGGAR